MRTKSPIPPFLDRKPFDWLPFRWEQVLWGALILAAIVTRFAMLEPRVMSHDESQHTQLAWYLYRGEGYLPAPMTHGPFQILFVALSYFMMGAGDFSARVPAAIFGVLAVALLIPFRRWLGRAGALAAGLLMTISPYMLYYSRYVRNESFVVVWGLLMFYAIGRYLEGGRSDRGEKTGRQMRWLYLLAAAMALHYATKETAYIYAALALVFLAGLFQLQLFRSRWKSADRRTQYLFLAILGTLLIFGAAFLCLYGRQSLIDAARAAGGQTDPEMMTHTEEFILSPIIQIGLALFALSLLAFGASVWVLLKEFPLPVLRERFPAVDLLAVLGTTMLPQLAAFPMALFNLNPWDGDPLQRIQDGSYIVRASACLLAVIVPAVVIGLAWDRRQWLVCAGIFFGIYFTLFSVIFTNLAGVAMGLVGSVNYWVAQQDVHRGSQPWYYYLLVQIPVYEYLPALLALSAPFVAAAKWRKTAGAKSNISEAPAAGNADVISGGGSLAFLWLIGFWCVGALAAFTVAGEKMPWLTVHITLPFILMGGWVIGAVTEGVEWPQVLSDARWVGWLILPALAVAVFSTVSDWIGPNRPFSGNTVDQIFATSNFLYSLLTAAAGIIFLSWLWRNLTATTIRRMIYLGVVALLGVLTFRTAWTASCVNYDDATEFLVYAHSAAGVKTVVSKVDEIARKTQDGRNLVVAYDDRSGWLMKWYLRDYPNQIPYGSQLNRGLVNVPVVIVSDQYWTQADRLLSNTHYAFSYMRLYWPMQDYYDLTWNRIWNALANPEYRSALWDIWFNRDYSAYAELTGENLKLSDWPGGEHFRLYVLKDIAMKIWQYGAEAFTPPVVVDPYAGSVQTLKAEDIWGQNGTEPGSFHQPRGIAVAPDGTVYIADAGNNRIQHFDSVGGLIDFWGRPSEESGTSAPNDALHEPWGVAVGDDGSVYVADTWNYRVQKFSAGGLYILTLGDTTGTGYPLFGPRAVTVDSKGRVLVADTGNKRVVIFDPGGEYQSEIGTGGFESGQFDEPVGLAVGPNGRLYVADTWNQRIQVFQEIGEGFSYITEWPIYGWEGESTEIKPYLAVSSDGRVWVTDPGNARILVFDAEGTFLFTFGNLGNDDSSFNLPTGIAVGKDGRIYITDTNNHRVMVFAAV